MSVRRLWVTNDLPPRAGGIEQFVGNLLAGGPADRTAVIGPAHAEAAEHDRTLPYPVWRQDGGVWPTPAVVARVRAAIEEHAADVVVLGAGWPLGELAPRLADRLPVVALTHGLEAGLASAGLGRLVRRATRQLAAATTISQFTEERLRGALAAARVERVPPGVDVDRFHPDVDGSPLRAAWGIPAGAPLVVCVSRLVHRKGQDVLLQAWPQVQRANPEAWLAIVGEGPRAGALATAAAALPRVRLVGRVDWDQLPAAHAAADVFAMPCRTRLGGVDVEGLGIVYLEAQACGVPVVAGRSGGAPETVLDGRTGLVIDGRRPDEVANALVTLLADPGLRERMGAAGRDWVVERWSWPRIVARFEQLLTDVVAGGSTGSGPRVAGG